MSSSRNATGTRSPRSSARRELISIQAYNALETFQEKFDYLKTCVEEVIAHHETEKDRIVALQDDLLRRLPERATMENEQTSTVIWKELEELAKQLRFIMEDSRRLNVELAALFQEAGKNETYAQNILYPSFIWTLSRLV